MDCLLANAWKFSIRPRSRPSPSACQTGVTGGHIYFVRDNGVGFDMAYANKLFVPFQRLHPDAEFQGSGIGLVTAQRVIARHNGRIWAEAQVNEARRFISRSTRRSRRLPRLEDLVNLGDAVGQRRRPRLQNNR